MGPWAFAVPLVLVSTLGLVVNAYVLLVVLGLGKKNQHQQTANTLLVIHLGAVETAVCLVVIIFTSGGWPVSGSSCVVHGFLLAVLHPVALWTVTGLNCDRYYAIAAPLHYAALVSPRRVTVGLAASWSGALLLSLPPFSGLVPSYKYNQELGCCIPDFGNGTGGYAATIYSLVYAILGLTLPALLVTACNLRVLGIARYHRHRIASAIYEVTLSAQVTITHQRNPFFVPTVTSPSSGGPPPPPPRFHSAAATVMQLVGSLYLLYFPYCGFILWEACGAAAATAHQHRSHAHPRLASLASLLLASSPPINGLLYGLKSPILRQSLENYWRKKVTKSELQQEIQARTPSAAGSRRPSGSGPVSLFPFPPLQRRLSEALITLANSRNIPSSSFESGNIATFHWSRLQPAVSCNTLRVPLSSASESGSGEATRLVRTSASAASLVGSRYRNNDLTASPAESPTTSPRILITRAYSIESQDAAIPLLPKRIHHLGNFVAVSRCDKRRWRHTSTESDTSSESSDASVWTTGLTPKTARANLRNAIDNWPAGQQFSRLRNLEQSTLIAGIRPNNNSESSDGTDTTVTTLTATCPLPSKERAAITEDAGICGTRIKHLKEQAEEIEIAEQRDESESEPSWSSVEERDEQEHKVTEDLEDNEPRKIGEAGKRNDREDRGESDIDGIKCRKNRNEGAREIISVEARVQETEGVAHELCPLLTPS